MATAKLDVPKIKFNGIDLDDIIGKSFEVTIKKNIKCIDEITIKAYGKITPDKSDTNCVYLKLFDPENNMKHNGKKYRLIEVKEGN